MAGRVFIFGAGFSKPANMPLATDLVDSLRKRVDDEDLSEWLDSLLERLRWTEKLKQGSSTYRLNIEEVFHLATFDIEVFKLRQQLAPVGRNDGCGTPWCKAEDIESWLRTLEEELRDELFGCQEEASLSPIIRWANHIKTGDSVATFNYDLLVELGINAVAKSWNHGFRTEPDSDVSIYKLHGSIDWIVSDKRVNYEHATNLFKKANKNSHVNENDSEERLQLWRVESMPRLKNWLNGRILQQVPNDAIPSSVGLAGLGTYKQLHLIPGLGECWANAMRRVYKADKLIIVGFAMSDFDKFAQLQFASIARDRYLKGNPINVTVVDPFESDETRHRFQRVFGEVKFVWKKHEEFDWQEIALSRPS